MVEFGASNLKERDTASLWYLLNRVRNMFFYLDLYVYSAIEKTCSS